MSKTDRRIASAMSFASARDRRRHARRDGVSLRIGIAASAWATAKFALLAVASPIWAPGVLAGAALNHRRARRMVRDFPAAVRSIAAGRSTHLSAGTVIDRPSTERIVVFSDLHRTTAGRRDWPERQGTKSLYAEVLSHYGTEEWTLCENGDVEDFWMVGGSTLGAFYDACRLAGAAIARRDRATLRSVYRHYLGHILDNNQEIYEIIRRSFVGPGRYVRTVGNHDDPLHDSEVAAVLRERLGPFPIGDFVALRDDGFDLRCLIAHGHHTDGWNAPHADRLGKFSTWLGTTITDVPGLSIPEGLPPLDAAQRLFDNGPSDRLITLNPIIGATTEYDSMDEELLFAAMNSAGLTNDHLVLGHTHLPMDGPRSKAGGTWSGYVNGGSGIVEDLITGVEWDGSARSPRPLLVAWTRDHDGRLERRVLSRTD